MDEKELSGRQTKALPQKELHEPFQSESESKKKGVLPVRDFYYRFRRSDEEEELEQNLEKKHKPEEPPHDHQEDHQQEPPPALRERRRPLVRLREDEEEDEEDQSMQTEASPIQDSSAQTDRVMSIENSTQEERRTEGQRQLPDEDVTDALIIKKDAETQTSIFQSDKGVEAYPELKDEEVQISPVREDRSAQAMPETRDIGTGEWLALQKSIGVGNHIDVEDKSVDLRLETAEKGTGNHLKTEDKAIGVSPKQEDKFIQEKPENESRGVGSPNPSFHNKSLQINPDAEDKSVQETPEHLSIGVGTDKKEHRDQSLQVFPSLQDKDIQKDISMADKSVQEQRKGLALSSIIKKENMLSEDDDSLSLDYSPSPLKKQASRSASFDSKGGIIKHMETIKSHYVPSSQHSQNMEFEDSYMQELSIKSRRSGIKMEDIPMDESIYPPSNQFQSQVEESEVIFSGFHKRSSLAVSELIEEEKKESQNVISFQSSSKKEESEEFEIIKKPAVSRHSSFSVMEDERD